MKNFSRRLILVMLTALMVASAESCSFIGDDIMEKEVAIEQKAHVGENHKFTQQVVNQTPYQRLQSVRKTKLPTYVDNYRDEDEIARKYKFAHEKDVVALSVEMADVLEDYFKSIGAIHWTSDDKKQFWPDGIGYTVAAIAYRESTYRTNIVNGEGCQGITCIKEDALMKSLGEWFTTDRWGDSIATISCKADEVDMLNPTTNIEYMYHEIGYYLAHWYKSFNKDRGKSSVWDKLEYSEELQERLIIATHLFGIGNMEDSIYKRCNEDGVIVTLEDYIYSDYVEDVLAKKQELINTYKHNLNR